jgi:hypothetical protein
MAQPVSAIMSGRDAPPAVGKNLSFAIARDAAL